MPLTKLLAFTKKVADLADKPNMTAAEVKAQFDAAPDEVRQYLNNAIDKLLSTTDGDSGADNIGVTGITGLTGTTVQTLLESLKSLDDTNRQYLLSQIQNVVLGQIPDNSVTEAKLSFNPATQTELDNLAGTGRTTETVKKNADAIATHQDDNTRHLNYAEDNGTTDAYEITLNPAPSLYFKGMVIQFKANTTNSGVATLNVNGLGPQAIMKNGFLDLVDNDIKADQIVTVVFDGTNFQLQSQPNYVIDSGTTTSFSATQNTWVEIVIPFNITFASAPVVTATLTRNGGKAYCQIKNSTITTNGFTLVVYNVDATTNLQANWIAVGR